MNQVFIKWKIIAPNKKNCNILKSKVFIYFKKTGLFIYPT